MVASELATEAARDWRHCLRADPLPWLRDILVELGHGRDPPHARAVDWLLAKQDGQARWRNEYAYNGKTWVDVEVQGRPSRWVTLRACRVLQGMGAAPA